MTPDLASPSLLRYEWIMMDDGQALLPTSVSRKRNSPPRDSAASTALMWRLLPCLTWVSASNGLIVLNKHIMASDDFHYPMALSAFGMCGSWLLSASMCRLRMVRTTESVSVRVFFSRFFPVGFFMAVMFYCGNAAYLYLSVAFVQVCMHVRTYVCALVACI